MNVLVIGKGGREHALVWKLAQSPLVETVFCAPGNPGMHSARCVDISGSEPCAKFAIEHDVGLTVVGPEAPLCEGIVDLFRARGLKIFGPNHAAAQLEGSKQFAKQFMIRHRIPTAAAESCDDASAACACIERFGAPVVVKADGLAAGKGVTVAQTEEEAKAAVREAMTGAFGEAGRRVLIEECLVGEEASIIALVDGKTIVPLASSQDHKRADEGDTGPNTGGMGAYSPAPVVDTAMWRRIQTEVLDRFLAGCEADGLDYRGVIYAGIMITSGGPKVLEFNVRFGDPETQAILPRLRSDLAAAMVAVVEGRLGEVELGWRPEAAACVVLAAGGYPGAYEKGRRIRGIEDAEATGALIFHAGTAVGGGGNIVTAGGRVLGVSALGDDIAAAVRNAYRAVDCISWPNMQFRRDIAHRAIVRERG